MKPRDWLLILCAYKGAPAGLDPVRIQKGMFLFARSGIASATESYTFRPYDYGPMSAVIYRDLDALVAQGLIEPHEVPGKRWSRYTATETGRAAADQSLMTLTTAAGKTKAQHLFEIKQQIATVSFKTLLESVYDAHPDMAVNSVFRRDD